MELVEKNNSLLSSPKENNFSIKTKRNCILGYANLILNTINLVNIGFCFWGYFIAFSYLGGVTFALIFAGISAIISIVNIATSVDIIKGKLSKKGKIFSISSVPITLLSIGVMLFAIIYCSMFGLI